MKLSICSILFLLSANVRAENITQINEIISKETTPGPVCEDESKVAPPNTCLGPYTITIYTDDGLEPSCFYDQDVKEGIVSLGDAISTAQKMLNTKQSFFYYWRLFVEDLDDTSNDRNLRIKTRDMCKKKYKSPSILNVTSAAVWGSKTSCMASLLKPSASAWDDFLSVFKKEISRDELP
jgi:hypothetical protein